MRGIIDAIINLELQYLKSMKSVFDIIAVSKTYQGFKVDLPELHKQFEELSEQVKDATKSQPVIAVLVNALLTLIQMLP